MAFAVPGIRKVQHGDLIVFDNQSGGQVTVTVAANTVLEGAAKLSHKQINKGKKRTFKVAAESGTHEFSIHSTSYDEEEAKTRTGFAIGASSPKIIIVPSTRH